MAADCWVGESRRPWRPRPRCGGPDPSGRPGAGRTSSGLGRRHPVGDWTAELKGNTTVLNLAGKLVDCRPTERDVLALTESTAPPTQALMQAPQQLKRPLAH